MFTTRRLKIYPARLETLSAEFHGREAVARALGVIAPESWPAEVMDETSVRFVFDRMRDHPNETDWWFHYFVHAEHNTLIGAGGYQGPPNAEGAVEIRYSILPEYRNQGYASEAVHALVEHAFDVALVKKVIADTWPDVEASLGVLGKCGFEPEGEAVEQGAVRYAIYRSRRSIPPPNCD